MKLAETKILTSTAQFRTDPFFVWTTRFSLIIQALCFFLLLSFWNRLPPVIPFYFSLPWGEEQLAKPVSLLFLVASGFLLSLFNSILAFFIFPKSSYISHILLLASTVISILIALTTVQIILMMT